MEIDVGNADGDSDEDLAARLGPMVAHEFGESF